jgi:predicted O-methyltransferase YrrM
LFIESSVHPHVPEERSELFHTEDDTSTEYEYLELLQALIFALKPREVLETGGYVGLGTSALAEAVRFNGLGHLTTVEINSGRVQQIKKRLGNLSLEDIVSIVNDDSQKFLLQTDKHFDFAFLDSDLTIRCKELKILLDRGLLKRHSFVAIHDTSKVREFPLGTPDLGAKVFWRELETLSGIRFVEFPYSRGLTLIEVL